jgi:hypothetical protein
LRSGIDRRFEAWDAFSAVASLICVKLSHPMLRTPGFVRGFDAGQRRVTRKNFLFANNVLFLQQRRFAAARLLDPPSASAKEFDL